MFRIDQNRPHITLLYFVRQLHELVALVANHIRFIPQYRQFSLTLFGAWLVLAQIHHSGQMIMKQYFT